ncbi:MAG: S41 family peptidase [Phycisphaerae bacterium]|jgi:carboxyl-terminal processing protease
MNGTVRRLISVGLVSILVPVSAVLADEHHRSSPVRKDRARTSPAASRFAKIVDLIEDSNVPYIVGERRWARLVRQHRDTIEQAATHRAFADAVNALIRDAGVSHFQYFTDAEWQFWHMRSAFWKGDPETEVCHVGIIPERIDGRWFVRGILEGSPAAGTRISVGDELLTVDGEAYDPVSPFRGTADLPTVIRLRRRPGLVYSVNIVPVRESLYDAMQEAMPRSIDIIEHDGLRMAYLHAWTMLGSGGEYKELAKLQDRVDGLLLDYRDGFGGTWHAAERFLLGGGRRSDNRSHWQKPVVILIADGTRSAKEIVVDAVQTAGRAPLIGEPTPGHVTSVGAIRRVGKDGLLELPGQTFSLEGNPTMPDYPVERRLPYCAGADPQMRKAKQVLSRLIREAQTRG